MEGAAHSDTRAVIVEQPPHRGVGLVDGVAILTQVADQVDMVGNATVE